VIGFVAEFYAGSRESNEKNSFGEKKIHARKLKRKYIRQVFGFWLFEFQKETGLTESINVNEKIPLKLPATKLREV